jgi:acyl carrier protein
MNSRQNTIDLPPKLIDYLNEQRAPRPPVADPDEPLQIDSLGLIRLVAFLENDLHIRIEDDELIAEHFATARAISALLASKETMESPASDEVAANPSATS